MPLNHCDRGKLKEIRLHLFDNPTVVMDVLPRLKDVLLPSDITRVEYRVVRDGYEWAANDLLDFYQTRATDLKPLFEALNLKKATMHDSAPKVGSDLGGKEFGLAHVAKSSLPDNDLRLLQKATPVLLQDGDATEIIEALYGTTFEFDQKDKQSILNQTSDRSRMMKFIEIYQVEAMSLIPLIDALRTYTAQPHIADILESK